MIFDVNRMWSKNGDHYPGLKHFILIDWRSWVGAPSAVVSVAPPAPDFCLASPSTTESSRFPISPLHCSWELPQTQALVHQPGSSLLWSLNKCYIMRNIHLPISSNCRWPCNLFCFGVSQQNGLLLPWHLTSLVCCQVHAHTSKDSKMGNRWFL